MVGLSVCLSSALLKNGRSDPDAVWHHRSDGLMDDAGGGVWESVQGKEYFWGQFEARHCNRRWCATVPQPSELRFGVVRAVGRGIVVLDGGPHRARDRLDHSRTQAISLKIFTGCIKTT